MSPASDEPLDDGPDSTGPFVPAESKGPEPDVTIGDTLVTPDPGATVDSAQESSGTAAKSAAASSDEDSALGATVIPRDAVSDGDASVTVMSDWEATLDADVEPGHTIKAPASVAKKRRGSLGQTIGLKRREVIQSAAEGTAESAEDAAADYQIEELLGEGGMGAVYAARQKSMDRPVAIKVLKPRAARLASSQDAFVSEAVITGKLDHPNIVPIYDVGKQPNDALFYAMKQVEGVEWKERFAENTVSENLDILLRVSDAIAFAHARGIVHRDLKPANIMLGPFGEVLVMDWGLAMPTEDHPSREMFPDARAGGTPHYMAPEMVDGTERVDRRSDVYLLGAILFEIVTGKPPHALDLPKGTRRERVLAVLDAVANNVIAPTDESGELLDIARKAIATEPADRYQTVPEFQTALREYLSHEESIELADRAAERLAAGRQSGEYTEFSRARFGFETALEAWPENERAVEGLQETLFDYAKTAFDRGDLDLALSLIDESDSKQSGLGASILQAIVDRDARQQQIRRLRRISLAASLVVAIVSIGAAVWINSERSKALVAQQEEATQREVAERNEKEAQQQREIAQHNEKVAEKQRELAESEREKAVTAQQEEAAQRQIAVSERENATAAEAVAKREADNALKSLRVAEQRAYESDMMVIPSLWNGHSMGRFNELLERYRDRDDLTGFEWRYWDRLRRSELFALKGHKGGVNSVAFSPDGTRLASASVDQTMKLWDVATGEEMLTIKGHTKSVYDLAFSPDGTRLASASADKTVKVWEAATGQEMSTLKGHKGGVLSVAFSPDGMRLASASFDRTVKVWDAVTGQEMLTLKGHSGDVHSVAFSPDGMRLATASRDQTVKVWDASTGQEMLTLKGHTGHVQSVAFSPDRTRLASAGGDNTLKVWDASTGQEMRTLKGHTHWVTTVAFSPDGTRLAAASGATVKVWEAAATQEMLTVNGHTDRVHSVAFSPDGTRLASASRDRTVKVWDTATWQEILTLKGHTHWVTTVAFSPDSARLASTSESPRTAGRIASGELKVWDAATGQQILALEGHIYRVTSAVFNPDGTRLASASIDQTVKLWDVATGQEMLTLKRPNVGYSPYARSTGLAFSPGGTLLAAGSGAKVKVWDAATGKERLILSGHTGGVNSVAFSPDGTRLASASEDQTVKVWDAVTGQEMLTLTGHISRINSVAFSPDGTRLASASQDQTVKLWDTRPWTPEQKVQLQSRGYLTVHRDRTNSLEDLQTYIRDDKTISEEVRQQCLDWSELFWKNRKAAGERSQ